MAQVDSENTTAMPAVSTRRGFLSQAAGVAAGSAVLIGASTIAAPAIASHGGPDPILTAIETHRAAEKAEAAACAEQSRREQILIDEGIGLCPFVAMVGNGRPLVAHTHQQIDAYAGSVTEQVAAKAHRELDTTLERYDAIFGNAENEAGKLSDIALDAFDNLIWTTPTTVHGARRLLDYLLEDVADLDQQFLGEEKLVGLLSSINEMLQALPSTVGVV